LTFDVISIFPVGINTFDLRVIILKEVELQKQEVIYEDHIADLINRED
jgi:hypothetical protein